MKARRDVVGLLLALVLLTGCDLLRPTPPPPTTWVTDNVGALTAQAHARLNERLRTYQRETGHEVIVWIDQTLAGEAIEDFCLRTFNAWGVGREFIDDGVVVFVFLRDRKVRIQVGYGLESRGLPDRVAARIVHEVMEPRFRRGDVEGAVTAGVSAVLEAIR